MGFNLQDDENFNYFLLVCHRTELVYFIVTINIWSPDFFSLRSFYPFDKQNISIFMFYTSLKKILLCKISVIDSFYPLSISVF